MIRINQTAPDSAIGYDSESEDDFSIFGTKRDGRWELWTDDHGSATGRTLRQAAERWARQYGADASALHVEKDPGVR
jgi:hypothetical protein